MQREIAEQADDADSAGMQTCQLSGMIGSVCSMSDEAANAS
jgi:hypothetical protein